MNKYNYLGAAIKAAATDDDLAEDFTTDPLAYLQAKHHVTVTASDLQQIINPALDLPNFQDARKLVQILRSRIAMHKAKVEEPLNYSGLMCSCA